MGYCSPQWVSDYTFSALAVRRAAVSGVAASLREGAGGRGPQHPAGAGRGARQVLLLGEGDSAQWGQPASDSGGPPATR
jgi:hypothetical protein